jgi:hypothetical protein
LLDDGSTQAPSQSAWGGAQPLEQNPPAQDSSLSQSLAHAPQFWGSEASEVHTPLHWTWPAGQMQLPATQ